MTYTMRIWACALLMVGPMLPQGLGLQESPLHAISAALISGTCRKCMCEQTSTRFICMQPMLLNGVAAVVDGFLFAHRCSPSYCMQAQQRHSLIQYML